MPAKGAGVPGNSLTAAGSDTKGAIVVAAGYSAAEAQMHQKYIAHFLKPEEDESTVEEKEEEDGE